MGNGHSADDLRRIFDLPPDFAQDRLLPQDWDCAEQVLLLEDSLAEAAEGEITGEQEERLRSLAAAVEGCLRRSWARLRPPWQKRCKFGTETVRIPLQSGRTVLALVTYPARDYWVSQRTGANLFEGEPGWYPLILLCHGQSEDDATDEQRHQEYVRFRFLFERLATYGFVVVSPQMYWCTGQPPRWEGGQYVEGDSTDVAGGVAALSDVHSWMLSGAWRHSNRLSLWDPIVAGHSAGATIVFEYAQHNPGVCGLVNIAGRPRVGDLGVRICFAYMAVGSDNDDQKPISTIPGWRQMRMRKVFEEYSGDARAPGHWDYGNAEFGASTGELIGDVLTWWTPHWGHALLWLRDLRDQEPGYPIARSTVELLRERGLRVRAHWADWARIGDEPDNREALVP